jgi:hypothetical protein
VLSLNQIGTNGSYIAIPALWNFAGTKIESSIAMAVNWIPIGRWYANLNWFGINFSPEISEDSPVLNSIIVSASSRAMQALILGWVWFF